MNELLQVVKMQTLLQYYQLKSVDQQLLTLASISKDVHLQRLEEELKNNIDKLFPNENKK